MKPSKRYIVTHWTPGRKTITAYDEFPRMFEAVIALAQDLEVLKIEVEGNNDVLRQPSLDKP